MSRLWVFNVWRNTKHWLRRSARISRSLLSSRLVSSPLVYMRQSHQRKGNRKENKKCEAERRELFHSRKHFACSKFGLMTLCMCTSIGGKVTKKFCFSQQVDKFSQRRTCVVYIPISIFHVIAWQQQGMSENPHILAFLLERKRWCKFY